MDDKEKLAIKRLQEASMMSLHYYRQPLVIAYSGGKDSDVLLRLAESSDIPYEVQHNHTTADAPETVRHVRETFKRLEESGVKCTINWPTYKGVRTSMWEVIPQKLIPPLRTARYCCAVLKEKGGAGRFIATGVRRSESAARKRNRGTFERSTAKERMLLTDSDERRLFEHCRLKAQHVVNPIIDWETDNVLDYAEVEKIQLNCLYQEGFHRVGCVGCPMAGRCCREREFLRWPAYKRNYILAFDKMIAERKRRNLPTEWDSGIDVFNWWMEYDYLPGQVDILEEL